MVLCVRIIPSRFCSVSGSNRRLGEGKRDLGQNKV